MHYCTRTGGACSHTRTKRELDYTAMDHPWHEQPPAHASHLKMVERGPAGAQAPRNRNQLEQRLRTAVPFTSLLHGPAPLAHGGCIDPEVAEDLKFGDRRAPAPTGDVAPDRANSCGVGRRWRPAFSVHSLCAGERWRM